MPPISRLPSRSALSYRLDWHKLVYLVFEFGKQWHCFNSECSLALNFASQGALTRMIFNLVLMCRIDVYSADSLIELLYVLCCLSFVCFLRISLPWLPFNFLMSEAYWNFYESILYDVLVMIYFRCSNRTAKHSNDSLINLRRELLFESWHFFFGRWQFGKIISQRFESSTEVN